MGQDYFRFKQFMVQQDRSAMKVGTDGVALGAWAGNNTARRILDVGTGTGLVALMLAQRFPDAIISGIEIDEAAAIQAAENFLASPFSNRLTAFGISFSEFVGANPTPFDLIVCNPPFFFRSLKGEKPARNLARHNQSLDPQTFFSLSRNCIAQNGAIALIIPFGDQNLWINAAENSGFRPEKGLILKPVPHKEPHRILISFSENPPEFNTQNITIETGNRDEYSPGFQNLVRNFYLKIPDE